MEEVNIDVSCTGASTPVRVTARAWRQGNSSRLPDLSRRMQSASNVRRGAVSSALFYGSPRRKQVQENLVLMFSDSCSLQAYALRYQNVYGPGQSLSNPYTGILAIFSSLANVEDNSIEVFEDGNESRDFVYIDDDVVEATWRFIAEYQGPSGSYNVGTGEPTSVAKVAKEIVRFFGDRAPYLYRGRFPRRRHPLTILRICRRLALLLASPHSAPSRMASRVPRVGGEPAQAGCSFAHAELPIVASGDGRARPVS